MIGPHSAPGEEKPRGRRCGASVVGVAVAAGKLRAGEPENFVYLGGSPTSGQQASGDPQVDDAPVGLRVNACASASYNPDRFRPLARWVWRPGLDLEESNLHSG